MSGKANKAQVRATVQFLEQFPSYEQFFSAVQQAIETQFADDVTGAAGELLELLYPIVDTAAALDDVVS